MPGVRIFYGSSSGNTHHVVDLLHAILKDVVVSITNISEADPDDLESASALILGISTWGNGEPQADWARFLPKMAHMNLKGKKVALFGLGDAKGFSGLFVNALRTLYDTVRDCGADVIGQWPTRGYEFEYSAAIENGQFVGLVIDQENQSDLTVQRVGEWAALVRPALAGSARRYNDPRYDNLG